jgi:hypothetical protein
MSKVRKTDRRLHLNSVHNTKKRLSQEERGPLVLDRKKWTSRDVNLLFMSYLGDLCYESGKLGMVHLLGRTWVALRTKIWKIAVQYCDPNSQGPSVLFFPDQHLWRKGRVFTKRDYHIMSLCLNPENKYSVLDVGYLAALLGRTEEEVNNELYRLAKSVRRETNLTGWALTSAILSQEEVYDLAYQVLQGLKG